MNKRSISVIALLCIFFVCVFTSWAKTKQTVDIYSPSMDKYYPATIIVPDNYTKSDNRYSVIYLLHGYSKDNTAWPSVAPLTTYSNRYNFIFVCPSGDHHSWYVDSPRKKKSKFETHIVKEVVPYVDSVFRTFDEYKGRAIIGSSMGGHGALTLMTKHTDVFLGAGSISGIIDLSEFPQEWGIADILGPYKQNRETWEKASFLSLFEDLVVKDRKIILDCGISDFALKGNRKIHAKLEEYQIAHDYYERPGKHSSRYATRNLEYHLLYFRRVLR